MRDQSHSARRSRRQTWRTPHNRLYSPGKQCSASADGVRQHRKSRVAHAANKHQRLCGHNFASGRQVGRQPTATLRRHNQRPSRPIGKTVEDLLAVSRLESKRMQLTMRAIDVTEAVLRVVRNLSDKAGDHKTVINIPPGLPPVWADADRLEQVLTNLIDNAIKYSPAKTDRRRSGSFNAWWKDQASRNSSKRSGVGMPEHLPQIFTKFGRLDNIRSSDRLREQDWGCI